MDSETFAEESQRKLADFIAAVENGTCVLDGIMSASTTALAKKFSAVNIDMTALWAYAPVTWSCPACGRRKDEIVRLNSRRELMCRLVAHHDHMKDLLLSEFRKLSASLPDVVADEQAEQFAKRSAYMVSAYDNTVICNDCNTADPEAKKAVGAHPHFSYSPAEIKKFVIVTPNAPHQIDVAIARAIWAENSPTFELRLRIVRRIAEIAATNVHWYQSTERTSHPDYLCKLADTVAAHWGVSGSLPVLSTPPKRESTVVANKWRVQRQPICRKPPTQGDIDHVARVTCKAAWETVPDNWKCPCCKREKSKTIRPTNQHPWAFVLATKTTRLQERPYTKNCEVLCGDCGSAGTKVGREVLITAGKYSTGMSLGALVPTPELAGIIIAKSHARHTIDNAKADLLVAKLAGDVSDGDLPDEPDQPDE